MVNDRANAAMNIDGHHSGNVVVVVAVVVKPMKIFSETSMKKRGLPQG